MSHRYSSPRSSCALHGALQTVLAINGAVPIIHSTAGCGVQHFSGSYYTDGGLELPSTNVFEKQIIFGGTSRLREQIKNTLKVVPGDLYVVLTGCATELVGDDVPAMVKEAHDQGYQVIHCHTAGFRGPAGYGYATVVKGLIDQLSNLPEEKAINTNLVNVFGIIPGQDPFWQGHLLQLQQILREVGLEGNMLFGFGEGIKSWHSISQAKVNIVFSSYGLEIAKHLEAKYAQPYLFFDFLPVGFEDLRNFLQKLQIYFSLSQDVVQHFLERENHLLSYALQKLAPIYFNHDFQRKVAVVGETALVKGLTRFLINPLGFIPRLIVITDSPCEPFRESFACELNQLLPGNQILVYYTEDNREIENLIRSNRPELILASSLEKEIARESGVPLLEISYPLGTRLIIHQSYLGIRGAISLIEDLTREISSNSQGIRDEFNGFSMRRSC